MADWISGLAVGEWYQAEGDPFEIIAIDVKNETILVQSFDGTLEDFDFDAWMDLGARACAPPEDYSGAMDMQREDFHFESDFGAVERWSDPLDYLDSRF